jgi:hypothetical protein
MIFATHTKPINCASTLEVQFVTDIFVNVQYLSLQINHIAKILLHYCSIINFCSKLNNLAVRASFA